MTLELLRKIVLQIPIAMALSVGLGSAVTLNAALCLNDRLGMNWVQASSEVSIVSISLLQKYRESDLPMAAENFWLPGTLKEAQLLWKCTHLAQFQTRGALF